MKLIGILALAIIGRLLFSAPLIIFIPLCLLALAVFGVGTLLFFTRKEKDHVIDESS